MLHSHNTASATKMARWRQDCQVAVAAGEANFLFCLNGGASLPELLKLDTVNTIRCYMFSETKIKKNNNLG